MKYRIHITKTAERDIDRAADHIEFILKNPTAADHLLERAEREINSLCVMPERFAPVDDPMLSELGIRFVKVGNYLAFYQISKQNRTVHIIRFLYGRSDWAALLREMG